MSDLLFEVASATNYAEKCKDIFHKFSRSVVNWQSTDYAIAPIEVLFKLEQLAFVTEVYMHPKLYKSIKALEILSSDNHLAFESTAKVYDFTDGVRIEISKKCRYIKLVVLEKEQGRPASIDFLRIYGHQYFQGAESESLYSSKKEKIEELFVQLGLPSESKWDVDEETLVTLHDMSKLKASLMEENPKQFKELLKDLETVLEMGKKLKNLQQDLKWAEAKRNYQKIKDIKNEIMAFKKRRDYFDEKYETSRFDDMIALDEGSNYHDGRLKELLEEDKKKLEEEKRRREEEERARQREIEDEFEGMDKEDEWWKEDHDHNKMGEDDEKPIQTLKNKHKKQEEDLDEKFKFNNPYVYNQGDADMEKYIKPLLGEFGPGFLGDPELLRKYEQLEYLDVLGARIWIAAHSQNWRQRQAGVQAVLNFCQDKLPERYKDGKTRNLFLALMEFARINAEDKVLQIYYLSLKIMTVALAPPICGDDIPPALINKSIQKFLTILVEKISEMNTRAKQISLKTLIAIFKHPAADISIAINETLKVCKEEMNVKFIPVQKQNPRIVQSRLEIMCKILADLPPEKTKKINYDSVLQLLVSGALFHTHIDVRVLGVKTLELVHKAYPQGTIEWYKSLNGLKPNISAEIESKLKIQ